MKRALAVVATIAFAVTAAALSERKENSSGNEFLQLREKRDKALAAVAEVINDGYRASLEQLLKRAIADGDTDSAAKIQFELQSIGTAGTSASLPARKAAPTPEMTTLKSQLDETKWRLNQDKTFMLHADGSSTSNWTPRKGRWKVIDATTVELDIGNIQRKEKVAVSQGATLMTWPDREEDQLHPQVARKIVPSP
ncbi:MAG: hypothetical protein QOE70_6161 [Chthoniobacter sp.]|jgi:hypothetical protein|nr:hypothetical protein [Chthoniobacter sp.]